MYDPRGSFQRAVAIANARLRARERRDKYGVDTRPMSEFLREGVRRELRLFRPALRTVIYESGAIIDPSTGEILGDPPSRKSVPNECKDRKDDRRHAILSGGHGGRNGFRRYRQHKGC